MGRKASNYFGYTAENLARKKEKRVFTDDRVVKKEILAGSHLIKFQFF